mgnify:CR=1 FL=1
MLQNLKNLKPGQVHKLNIEVKQNELKKKNTLSGMDQNEMNLQKNALSGIQEFPNLQKVPFQTWIKTI